jgi:hypothetical protein
MGVHRVGHGLYRGWRRTAIYATIARLAASREPPPWPTPLGARKVFVVGCPRSGTSWVKNLLAGFFQIVSGPESHAYPQIVGPFSDLGLRGAAGWQRVLDRFERRAARGLHVGVHTWIDRGALLRLIDAALHERSVPDERVAERVVEAVLDHGARGRGATAGHVVVEKSPLHTFWVERILRQLPDVRIVEVLRDGRDVCVSMQMRALTQRWAPRDRRIQAEMWARYADEGTRWRREAWMADRILTVRFEAMRSAPEATTWDLATFVGLAPSPAEVRAALDVAHIERRPNRGPGLHVRSGAVGDWRAHFTADDERIFRDVAGEAFTRRGYRF